MGYTSDVFYSVSHEGWDYLMKLCRQACSVTPETANACWRLLCWHREPEVVVELNCEYNSGVIFGWKNEKWYEEHEDVAHVISLMEQLKEAGYSYNFVRIGEHWEDTELEIDCEAQLPALYINRSVSWDECREC